MSIRDIGANQAKAPTIDEILQKHSASAAAVKVAEQAVGAAAAKVGELSWDWLRQASASDR